MVSRLKLIVIGIIIQGFRLKRRFIPLFNSQPCVKMIEIKWLLEAQQHICSQIDVTYSLPNSLTKSRLSFLTISLLFVNWFGRSLRLLQPRIWKGHHFWWLQEWKCPVSVRFWILRDFRKLIVCGHCGPCWYRNS